MGFEESSSLRWGGEVDPIPVPVDDHVMVVPTKRCEVVGVMGSTLGAGGEVVGLEPVAGPATVSGAGASVPVEDEPSQFGWDGAGGGSDGERIALRGGGEDFDFAVAEDLFEGERSDPDPLVGCGSGLPTGFRC